MPSPIISESVPISSAGKVVGALAISRSLRPALLHMLTTLAISMFFAALVFFCLKTIPIRALHLAFAALEDEKERALITLQSIGDAVVTTDAQMRIQALNPIAEKLIGWTLAEAIGQPLETVFRIVREGTQEPAANPIKECLEKDAIVEMENHTVLIRKTDGAEFHIEDSAAPIRRATGEVIGAVMVFHDITERRTAQQRLHHIAHHDGLTGLPNRTLFYENLHAAMERARSEKTMVAVLFLDLDRFKLINDSLGHDVGDQLLILTANRLRRAVRASDTIARMGGDEFTAILRDLTAADAASGVAKKIVESIAKPFHINGQTLFVTTSIGIALYPDDGAGIDVLLKSADAAMYKAKDAGRNTWHFYTAAINEQAEDQLYFENQLHMALERNEFFLEYQPKLDLRADRVVGMEALIRWQHPGLGVVPPTRFIPSLEASGQITAVGSWVMHTALHQAKQWVDAGYPISIAVNVSARQFVQENLLETVEEALLASGLSGATLEIEITESLLMQNSPAIEAQLQRLKAAGISIALDDFGTGYSSLGYLRRFPIDVLKIDKSFVQETDEIASKAIIKTIIELGHAFDMRVVAEGIETADQCCALREAGCDIIQGYWLSRPMPAARILDWLQSHQEKQLIHCSQS